MSLDKWRKYYRDGSIPPWDSRLPSSQLIRFMSECPQQLISMSRTDMILCQDVASQHKTSGRLHTCPKCEDLWSMRHEDGHGTFNCLEFACGTGASCVYMAQTLGKRARVIGVDVVKEAVQDARKAACEARVQETCAFIQADVFKLMGEGVSQWTVMDAWDMVAEQSEATTTGDAASEEVPGGVRAAASEAASSRQGPFRPLDDPASDDMGCFDLIYDCQAFHALRSVDEAAYLRLLRGSLRRGGLLMLLTGNANEPETGPSVLTEQELIVAFPKEEWDWLFLLQTRFDTTPSYGALDKPPLAWWGLLRKI